MTDYATLDQIALTTGTDKASSDHGYCTIYDELFGHLRDEPVKLLELGVWKGASIRMWNLYFTNAQADIRGIDRDVSGYDGVIPQRVKLYVGDQAAMPAALQGWQPDIVIDDASHLSSKTIASFHTWFPALKPGGLYIVEDLVTSYYLGGPEESHSDPDGVVTNKYGQTAVQFLRQLVDMAVGWVKGDIESIAFYRNMAVIGKAP